MSSILDRDRLLSEVADLRDRVADLEEENRQLHEAMTPTTPFPASWHVTGTEARLLHALRRAKGKPLHREQLFVCIYGFDCETEIKVLDVMVCKLRKKLKPWGVLFRSHWGQGYSLTPESLPVLTAALAPPAALAA